MGSVGFRNSLVKDIFLELNEHFLKNARMCADFYSNNEHFSV